MKNKIRRVISALILVFAIFTLAACSTQSKKQAAPKTPLTTKATQDTQFLMGDGMYH